MTGAGAVDDAHSRGFVALTYPAACVQGLRP
jgi:hypothetical protein